MEPCTCSSSKPYDIDSLTRRLDELSLETSSDSLEEIANNDDTRRLLRNTYDIKVSDERAISTLVVKVLKMISRDHLDEKVFLEAEKMLAPSFFHETCARGYLESCNTLFKESLTRSAIFSKRALKRLYTHFEYLGKGVSTSSKDIYNYEDEIVHVHTALYRLKESLACSMNNPKTLPLEKAKLIPFPAVRILWKEGLDELILSKNTLLTPLFMKWLKKKEALITSLSLHDFSFEEKSPISRLLRSLGHLQSISFHNSTNIHKLGKSLRILPLTSLFIYDKTAKREVCFSSIPFASYRSLERKTIEKEETEELILGSDPSILPEELQELAKEKPMKIVISKQDQSNDGAF